MDGEANIASVNNRIECAETRKALLRSHIKALHA